MCTHLHIDAYFHYGFYYCCCWTTTCAVAFHSLFFLALTLPVCLYILYRSPYDTLKHSGVNISWTNISRTRAHLLVCSPCTQTSIYLLLWFWFQFSFLLHFVSVVTAVHFGGFPPSFFSRTRFFVVENFRKFNLFLCIHITHSHICILYYMVDIFILSL